MANLTILEKRQLERLFDMGGGYVLNFSNRELADIVTDSVGCDIFDPRYNHGSGSKANRMRAFWKVESNQRVGQLLTDLIAYGEAEVWEGNEELRESCKRIAARLKASSPVEELQAITASEPDFERLATQIRAAIENNEPEAALDRLHTYVIRFFRNLCEQHGIPVTRDKALHSLVGEYVKRLREKGHLSSEMSARILKTNISVLEAFNDVRNNQSLAHDNATLNYEESLLIFNNIANIVRFIRALEERIKPKPPPQGRSGHFPSL